LRELVPSTNESLNQGDAISSRRRVRHLSTGREVSLHSWVRPSMPL